LSSPITLAVESSGQRSAVALLRGEELLVECEFARGAGGRGSGSPAAAADEALRAAGIEPANVELVAASIGPGSYTGLRVGVSFAKCFAWALSLPTVAVSSLEALCEELPLPRRAKGRLLIPTANAFRKQIYARAFAAPPGESAHGLTADLVLLPAELPARLREQLSADDLSGGLLVFGSGYSRYAEELAACASAADMDVEFAAEPASPSAASVGRLGQRLLAAGKTVTAHDLIPVYLRKTEAEERLEPGSRR
jgi:tRNA threonylcarbamoyladenosine biosynthesis protein TsaB